MKVGNTTLFATRSNSSRLYEFPVEPSLPFQRGDILGIFQPSNSLSRLRIYYRIGSGNPLNFVFRPPASVKEPPLETFNTSISGITRQTVLPLVTMEICKLYKSSEFKIESIDYKITPEYVDVIISIARSTSAVTLPLLAATASARLSPTSTTFTLLRTPAILNTLTVDILPTILPQPFSYTNTFSTSDTTSNYPATSNTIETSSSHTTPSTLLLQHSPTIVSHAESWLNHTVPMHTTKNFLCHHIKGFF